ncbi:hypothetical protein PC121_g16065 [Phytophthora cactorum]|nr:hypothetical protein PC120_g15080 [Phytophthora cactorum]KAG3054889.1 hypothetical protein PC121_g16065 [Phytophthora cactorum]KAG4041528.1 hypothetical protein PC123_g22961 [Phytophthora cactorum]
MYNGIGLRTVRGSGTNGYVQRNLSYVNASRTRQMLARNQRGGSSGDFGSRGGGRNRPPPNPDILLHEQKRKVELQLLEMSLEMEDRGCDPEEIQDKVKRERERLLARLNDAGDRGREKAKDSESSHARQKRKEEENKRIKDAFGIATDYVAGESFDPEMQERRRQERKERRDLEWKEREEARQLRLKAREEREETMKARRERFRSPYSRSRSRSASCSRRSRSPGDRCSRDRRSRGRDSKFSPRSAVAERPSRRSSSTAERKRRSVSSSSSGSSRSSSRSRSRSRGRKARKGKHGEKDSTARQKKTKRSRSSSNSESDSGSDRNRNSSRGRGGSREKKAKITKGKVKEEKLSISVSPARSAVRNGERKVLNLSGCSASAVANDESPVKEELKGSVPSEVKEKDKNPSPATEKQGVKREALPEKKVEKQESIPTALPIRVKKEEKADTPRSPAAALQAQPRKRKLRSASRDDPHRRGRTFLNALENSSPMSSSSSSAATAATSQPPSTSISIPEDGRSFLSESGANSSSGGLQSSSTSTPSGCSRALQRRFPRVRRCLARVSMKLPMSRAASGLTVIVALLMVGIVGTFALHQMMSPEIEALTQQREKLKDDVMALRLQVENITRIAESRLVTIHLLETELERQHVQAAEAAATATTGTEHGAIPHVANEDLKSGELRPSVVLPTIFYTLLLGSVLLASVLYRIFLIIRGEIVAQYKLGKKQYAGGNDSGGLMMPSVSESSMDSRRNGRGTPPLSPTRGPIVDDSVSSGSRSAASGGANSSLSPKSTSEPSPQCYKRAPGSSPTIV